MASSAVVTRRLLHLNAGASAACATTCEDRVAVAAARADGRGVVGLLTGEAEVMELIGAGDFATCASGALLHALSAPTAPRAVAAIAIRCTRLA